MDSEWWHIAMFLVVLIGFLTVINQGMKVKVIGEALAIIAGEVVTIREQLQHQNKLIEMLVFVPDDVDTVNLSEISSQINGIDNQLAEQTAILDSYLPFLKRHS